MNNKINSVFNELSSIDISNKIAEKGRYKYLSWSWAWSELLNKYPLSTFEVHEKDGIPYFTDGKTAWVKVTVCIGELKRTQYLAIMNSQNKSIEVGSITSVDMNKSIQRCLVKAIALHGLGLHIYAGEDLPCEEYLTDEAKEEKKPELLPENTIAWNRAIEVYKSDKNLDKVLLHMRISDENKDKIKGLANE